MEERVDFTRSSSPEQIINFSCELGRQLLQNGAEIYRVEDSLQRLLTAYGYAKAEIFAIPFCIILTIQEGDHNYTKSVRIQTVANNLRRLNELNALCRDLCRESPPIGESWWRLKQILKEPVYPPVVGYCAHGIVASFFTLFWGGTWVDALLAFPCGLLVKLVVTAMRRAQINIGTIMLLVPGIAITNGMRDVLVGDFLTALTRFAEVIIVALSIAVGVAAAITVTRFFLGSPL